LVKNSKIADFDLPCLHLAPSLGWPCWNFTEIFGIRKQRVPALLYGIACMILRFDILVQYWHVIDGQTEGPTHNDSILPR